MWLIVQGRMPKDTEGDDQVETTLSQSLQFSGQKLLCFLRVSKK